MERFPMNYLQVRPSKQYTSEYTRGQVTPNIFEKYEKMFIYILGTVQSITNIGVIAVLIVTITFPIYTPPGTGQAICYVFLFVFHLSKILNALALMIFTCIDKEPAWRNFYIWMTIGIVIISICSLIELTFAISWWIYSLPISTNWGAILFFALLLAYPLLDFLLAFGLYQLVHVQYLNIHTAITPPYHLPNPLPPYLPC